MLYISVALGCTWIARLSASPELTLPDLHIGKVGRCVGALLYLFSGALHRANEADDLTCLIRVPTYITETSHTPEHRLH